MDYMGLIQADAQASMLTVISPVSSPRVGAQGPGSNCFMFRQALKKQLLMVISINKLQNAENDQTAIIRLKPLPASPCQGRSGFGSPPDKGELEGVWSLDTYCFLLAPCLAYAEFTWLRANGFPKSSASFFARGAYSLLL
jgi:hypothetical protein